MAEIDTSIVDVASVRLYWQKKTAKCATCTSLLDHDVPNSRASAATFTGSSSASTSAAHITSSMPSEINISLLDGFDSENPMVLMAVSSDDYSPRHSSPPPPPFQVDDISPITCKRKGVESFSQPNNGKKGNPVKASVRGVQKWPDLQKDTNVDVVQDGGEVSSCTCRAITQNTSTRRLSTCHTSGNEMPKQHPQRQNGAILQTTFILEESVNDSDEENQMSLRAKKPSHASRRSAFNERSELSSSCNTKIFTTQKFSIPAGSLLFERLERRVGKQIRSRAKAKASLAELPSFS